MSGNDVLSTEKIMDILHKKKNKKKKIFSPNIELDSKFSSPKFR